MRRLLLLALMPWLAWAGPPVTGPAPGEPSDCPECHQNVQREFQNSRMAMAARTADFIEEWEAKERVERCLACHAPSGGEGVICRDCHGDLGHPYPKLETPAVCARCHDAPGEVTVRSFAASPASRRGEDCIDCHVPADQTFSHDFMGPSRDGYLRGVARLRLSLRREAGGDTLLIRISHRAGHALPGGTTGRSVWLVVETYAQATQPPLARTAYRFGWYHDPGLGWQDRTLPPGPGKVIEMALHSEDKPALVKARLIYRFRPGPLEAPDSREVILDRAEFALPPEMGESQ